MMSGEVKEANAGVNQHELRACALAKIATSRDEKGSSGIPTMTTFERDTWINSWFKKGADRVKLLARFQEKVRHPHCGHEAGRERGRRNC